MIIEFKIFEGSVKSSEKIDIFRDNKYILVAPLTAKASMKYGSFTNWCTSVTDGSYMDSWNEKDSPNSPNGTRGLLILIRNNYKMTKRNEKNSELYHYLWQKYEGAEITKKEQRKLEELHEDDDYLNLSKLCITFTTNRNSFDCWAANNINMELSDIYELENYGIDDYIIDKIDDYINEILINTIKKNNEEKRKQ